SSLGRPDIALTLTGLAGAIDALVAGCTAATRAQMLAYLDNLIAEMNAPFLANYAASLGAARSAIAAGDCAGVPVALGGLSTVLTDSGRRLSSPVAFPFDLSLAPNTALALPGQPATFKVILRNNSTRTNTYDLSVGALPSGVTGGLSVPSVTLPPGGTTAGSAAPVLTLTESGASVVPVQFTVTASISGVSGSGRAAAGTLTVQDEFLAVTSVVATPAFTTAGGSVDVTARLANVVNQGRAIAVTLLVKNG